MGVSHGGQNCFSYSDPVFRLSENLRSLLFNHPPKLSMFAFPNASTTFPSFYVDIRPPTNLSGFLCINICRRESERKQWKSFPPLDFPPSHGAILEDSLEDGRNYLQKGTERHTFISKGMPDETCCLLQPSNVNSHVAILLSRSNNCSNNKYSEIWRKKKIVILIFLA